jgi:RNA polymerase sigma factor (sigma-70 family)
VSVAAAKQQREKQPGWNDERLVRECVNGNPEAWSALIEKYKNLIFSVPIKLGMHQEAPDIFQSVCLDLLTDLPKIREPRALPKWLMQATYRKCLRYKRNPHDQVSIDEPGRDLADENVDAPVDLIAQLEREQMLRNVMSELPQRCESMIRMLFFETPPRAYNTIAAELGLATGSIGFIRGRCLAKLRKALERKGF